MSKEFLEEIKKKAKHGNKGYYGGYMSFMDTNWLIEQVEQYHQAEDKQALIKANIDLSRRVQELENSEREWVLYQTEVHGIIQSLERQNKRYREALEEIITLEEYNNMPNFWHDEGDFYDYLENLARKALEGELDA